MLTVKRCTMHSARTLAHTKFLFPIKPWFRLQLFGCPWNGKENGPRKLTCIHSLTATATATACSMATFSVRRTEDSTENNLNFETIIMPNRCKLSHFRLPHNLCARCPLLTYAVQCKIMYIITLYIFNSYYSCDCQIRRCHCVRDKYSNNLFGTFVLSLSLSHSLSARFSSDPSLCEERKRIKFHCEIVAVSIASHGMCIGRARLRRMQKSVSTHEPSNWFPLCVELHHHGEERKLFRHELKYPISFDSRTHLFHQHKSTKTIFGTPTRISLKHRASTNKNK